MADLGCRAALRLAPDALYFAAAISDDVLVGNNSPQVWDDDVIELSILVPGSDLPHLFTLCVDGRQTDNGIPISSLTVVTQTIVGGWAVEAANPARGVGSERILC